MDLDMVMAFTEKLRDMLGSERITVIFPTFRFCGLYLYCVVTLDSVMFSRRCEFIAPFMGRGTLTDSLLLLGHFLISHGFSNY
jgi:hypothetical protein